jgi:hypothetical protein
MKKHLFGLFTALLGLYCLLPVIAPAQSCDPVTKISFTLYNGFRVGEYNTMSLRAENSGIYLPGTQFILTNGTLPPGLILGFAGITGIPTEAGTYTFTVGAKINADCPVALERTFTLTVWLNLPCDEFQITTTGFAPSQNANGQARFYTEHFDSVQYTAISLPPGFSLNHTAGSYMATVSGTAEYATTHTIILAAQTNQGCHDTIRYTWQIPCPIAASDSITPRGPKLAYGVIGIPYDQHFADTKIALSEGNLPPGLTIDNDRIIGIPTTTGIYHFKLQAIHATANCAYAEQPYYIEVSSPNTTCQIYDALTPTPAEVSANTYYVKRNFSIAFSASRESVVDDSAKFSLTEGNLPDGIVLNGNILSGQIDHAETWNFTIGAFSKDGCPYYEQQYAIQFILKDSCDAFNIVRVSGGPSPEYNMVGIGLFDIVSSYEDDSVAYEAVSLPPGFWSDPYPELIYIGGTPEQPGIADVVIAGTSSKGCQDTLVITRNFTCIPPERIIPDPGTLTFLPVDEPYSQYFGFENPTADASFYHVEVIQGQLPPGLTLMDQDQFTGIGAILEGIPNTSGTYTFTIGVYVGPCLVNQQIYTLVVRERTPFRSITVHADCAESLNNKRLRVHNPNNFAVDIAYRTLYYQLAVGYATLHPGDNYIHLTNNLMTPPTEPTVPNTLEIHWGDGDGTPRTIVKSPSTELCNPPACAYASDVISRHQGLTKRGYTLNAAASRTIATLGEADAIDNDPAIHARYFSLGYSGFIVLRMSSNIYNEPGNDFVVHEYSEGEPAFAKNPERAEVQISQNGTTWISLGLTTPASCQGTLDHAFDIAGKLPWFRYVKVIDKTDRHARILNGACSPTDVFAFGGLSDGFDLDAITCANGNTFAREAVTIEEESSNANTSVLYPNPVKDWLTIDLSKENITSDKQVELRVIDLSGNSLYRNIHSLEADGTTQIKVSDLSSGMYILRIRTATGPGGFYKFIKD